MKLKDLWIKYENSGINGGEAITDKELKELSDKLGECVEFFAVCNPVTLGLRINQSGIDNMIRARE